MKNNPYNMKVADLQKQFNGTYARMEKEIQELRWDVMFLANHLKLQANYPLNNNPRFVPYPKPPKVKFMRRFWNAIQGR